MTGEKKYKKKEDKVVQNRNRTKKKNKKNS